MMTLKHAIGYASAANDKGKLNPLWREVIETLLEEVKRKPFEPDWVDFRTGFSNGYEQGKEDAATFCLNHVNYADSTMDHEELLIHVAGTIKNLHYEKPNTGENLDPCRCHACQIAEEANEIPYGNDDGSIIIPPLSAAILADMIDQQADELKYDAAIKRIGAFKVLLVLFAKRLVLILACLGAVSSIFWYLSAQEVKSLKLKTAAQVSTIQFLTGEVQERRYRVMEANRLLAVAYPKSDRKFLNDD